MREAHREGAKAVTRTPTPLADHLIERGMESRGIDCFPEWLLSVPRKSNDGFGPSCRVAGGTREFPPHNLAALVGKLPGKGPFNPDKAVLNELPYLRAVEHARGFIFTGRHENPHIARPTIITRAERVGRLVRSVTMRVAPRH